MVAVLTVVLTVSAVFSYILPDASRESGQKTRMVKRSVSPKYNHTMVYDGFHASDLREACAELTVWQRDGLKRHILGGVRLSCGTGESQPDPTRTGQKPVLIPPWNLVETHSQLPSILCYMHMVVENTCL